MNSSPGTSLVSGIQDISAFLPVIGTEQCERHVGEVLGGGFLYAAATPLSLFRSLGIVKAGTAILGASVSARTTQLLADAGFNLEGSVTAMMGTARSQRGPRRAALALSGNLKKETADADEQEGVEYFAGKRFVELLAEQHIGKSQMVQVVFNHREWNRGLYICTCSLACLVIAPYVRIIMQDQESSPLT
jgi:hypothetical protein